MESKNIIEKAWENRALLDQIEIRTAIEDVIEKLDKGVLRVAEPTNHGW
ncbi:MAG: 2,3,4,5-tetrahydropyridine-2,6-dicarboxylate N-succinyltransferase, partial [Bacteroidota bacterium]